MFLANKFRLVAERMVAFSNLVDHLRHPESRGA